MRHLDVLDEQRISFFRRCASQAERRANDYHIIGEAAVVTYVDFIEVDSPEIIEKSLRDIV